MINCLSQRNLAGEFTSVCVLSFFALLHHSVSLSLAFPLLAYAIALLFALACAITPLCRRSVATPSRPRDCRVQAKLRCVGFVRRDHLRLI
jgi:hypothetical protein